ncbi:hypothetical protein D9M68_995780 [compost metagenome]
MAGLDCWGQLLMVRREMGLPDLDPLSGVTRHTPLSMAHRYREVSGMLEECVPQHAAIAAVFRARVFVHVAVVITIDNRLAVLETNPKSGARWLWLRDFLSLYQAVTFYRDRT